MSEPKRISPLLDHFAIGDAISSHDGVSCYPAMREDSDEKYIVKIISIPQSKVQLDALLLTGAYPDAQAAQAYFQDLVHDVDNEAKVLKYLSRLDGFLAYDDYQIVPKEDGIGFDVYLVGSYKRSLAKFMRRNPMTHLGALNLGIDLCTAVSVCRQAGCLYIDLKPDNIFITEDGRYRIGDLGFIPLSSLKYASLPDKYRSSWTAPEVVDAFSSLNTTMDIYAIGLVLYQAYNNGTLPFEGSAPAEPLPAPMYADYEMAEIILKACAPKPEDRWQDPKQLGQALVAYMQRNGANDTPIVPPAVPITEPEPADSGADAQEAAVSSADGAPDAEAAEAAPEADENETGLGEDQAADAELPRSEEEEQADPPQDQLSFISTLVSDETAPGEEDSDGLEDTAVGSDLSDMLAQADELIAHETPAPAVAPEPVEILMPEPIVPELEDVPNGTEDDLTQALEDTDADPTAEEPVDASGADVNSPEAEGEVTKKPRKALIAWLVTLLMLIGLAAGAYYYYSNYYLQNIDQLTLDGAEDTLTVKVSTDVRESLLTVVCTDTYGTTQLSKVTDGSATFQKLKPGSQYTISVEIDGLHKLTGNTSASYATPPETKIVSFTAAAGSEDGSVFLSFTVDGQEPELWSVSCSTDGEEAFAVAASGHTASVSGLTVGKTYIFRLVPAGEVYLTGTPELTYTVPALVFAENLAVTACDGENLTIAWKAPDGIPVSGWTVRCYNDGSYDQTIVTKDCTATFTGVDTSSANTIEVTAEGMTQCARTFLTADPITITQVNGDYSNPNQLIFQWDYTGKAPDGGWLLVYTVDGSPEEVVQAAESTALLPVAVPGAQYHLTIQAANGATVFNGTFTSEIPEAESFSGYGVTAGDMEFAMCRTPDIAGWDRYDLSDEDYKTEFTAGEKASILVHLRISYDVEYEDICTLYVIRNSSGSIVSAQTQVRQWIDMWSGGYCELDIPTLPGDAGDYTVEIYFNGAAITSQEFSIK